MSIEDQAVYVEDLSPSPVNSGHKEDGKTLSSPKEDCSKLSAPKEDTQKLARPKEDSPKSDSPNEVPELASPNDEINDDGFIIGLDRSHDDHDNETSFSFDDIQRYANHSLKLKSEIQSLKETQANDYVKRIDTDHIDLPKRTDYMSDAEYKREIDGYVSQNIGTQAKLMSRHQAAQAKLLTTLGRDNPDIINHLDELAGLPKEAAYALSVSDHSSDIIEGLLSNKELLNQLSGATEEQAKDFISKAEGRIVETKRQKFTDELNHTSNFFGNLASGIDSITGGKVTPSRIQEVLSNHGVAKGLMFANNPVELLAYLSENDKILNEIKGLSGDKLAFELGKKEGAALLFTKSLNFKEKYPKSIDFKADEDYKGYSSHPVDLNGNMSDQEFNRRFSKKRK